MLGHMETPFKHFFSDRIYPGTLDELTPAHWLRT